MNISSDEQLLREYADRGSQPAFEELVRRHLDLVYSAALRIVRRADGAEDVTQSTFAALAEKARQVADHPVLSGWLHCTVRNIALKEIRTEARRRAREKEAAVVKQQLTDDSDAPWENVSPHLDDALDELSDSDRAPLLLRYFEQKSAREIGQALGITEEAAQKRVTRAVERLRDIFARRDVQIGTTALVLLLTTNVVQSAPAGLSAAVAQAAGLKARPDVPAGRSVRSRWRSKKPALALAVILVLIGLAVVLTWLPRPAGNQRTAANPGRTTMNIQIVSVMVPDQARALRFYTDVVGLVVKFDIPAGGARWLTLVSPEEREGTELLLEPIGLPAAGVYQKQLFEAGIPLASLAVGDLRGEVERMKGLGASFKVEPAAAGQAVSAVFDDTCGNLIQLLQQPARGGAAAPSGVKVRFSSVLVDDQARALEFYTGVLGFVKKQDLPAKDARRLTVVSPNAPEGTELVIEPLSFPPAKTFQAAVRQAGLPLTAFAAGDVRKEYERLKGLGVTFTMPPTEAGPTVIAVFDDTCGNRIQIFQN
jgi:RNA polymerase sigma factor (sigma-70 family)